MEPVGINLKVVECYDVGAPDGWVVYRTVLRFEVGRHSNCTNIPNERERAC